MILTHLLLIIYLQQLLSHDTVDIDRKFNMIKNKAIQASTKQHQTTIRTTQPILQHHRSGKYEQLLLSPRSSRIDRYRPDYQVRIRTKIRVKPIDEPSSKPIKIASATEYKHSKRSPVQHTIRTICTKGFKNRGNSYQGDLCMDNNKFHPFGHQ